jgi:mono/diheme cytochrome c family protein
MKKVLTFLGLAVTLGFAAPIDGYMQSLANEAKQADGSFKGFDAKRGEKIFTSEHIGKKGKNISCASCHTNDLKQSGKNIFTEKVIDPLSPKVNKERLSDVRNVEKWLKRNFNDVYKREGTAVEKGDVLTYIKNY